MVDKHLIQIVGLKKDKNNPKLNTLGIILVEDKKHIVYNPCFKGTRKLHWTYHKDGTQHTKDQSDKIIFSCKKIPLKNMKSGFQFLFSAETKEHFDGKLKYSPRGDNYGLFLIDLTNFKKGIGVSIHISDYQHINQCAKHFNDKPEHQCFIYWKSSPKIIVHAFDN